MRSLNWTDHANMTKQQTIDLVDIDLKLLLGFRPKVVYWALSLAKKISTFF